METTNIMSFVIGAITGIVGGFIIKSMLPSSKEKRLITTVKDFNEKYNSCKREKQDLETRMGQLKQELDSYKSTIKDMEDRNDDADDAIDELKKSNKKLIAEKDEKETELTDIKYLLTIKNQQIEDLKEKLSELSNKK